MEECEDNEIVMENKFVIMLNEFKLDVFQPVQLIIKYDYTIFSKQGFRTTTPIQVYPNKNEEYKIRDAYNEYKIIMNQTDMKIALDSNPFKIRFCNKNAQLGEATADLSKLFSPEAEDMRYGKRYWQDFPIIGMNNEENIGYINCTFVLEREICILCKSCNLHFKISAILKHVKNKASCKLDHTDEDIESLENQSAVRIKEKRNIRERKKYDPKKQSEKNKKYYNPAKRAERHRKILKQETENKARELETAKKRIFEGTKKNLEKQATEKNFHEFQRKKSYLDEGKSILGWNQILIPENIETKYESFEHKIFNLQSKLERKIDETSTFIDDSPNLTLSYEIKEIWNKMKEKIKRDWQKLGAQMDQEFRGDAKDLGASEKGIEEKFNSISFYL